MNKRSNTDPNVTPLKLTSVFYVNYAPYGNAGNILDYLKESFLDLVYVSFVFHPVDRSERNRFEIYHNGVLQKCMYLPTIRAPKKRVQQLAPVLSIVAGLELLVSSVYVRMRYKFRPEIFLAPNAFLIQIGVLLRALSLVDKVVFWVWDYYPTGQDSIFRRIFYNAYWTLDRWATHSSNFVWYISERLHEVRQQRGVHVDEQRYYIGSLGIDVVGRELPPPGKTIGFLGVLKKGQGLELLLESLDEIVRTVPDISFEVIGSGPDEELYKRIAAASQYSRRVHFRGFIISEDDVKEAVCKWSVALAPYMPSADNVSVYADPSKVRIYLGCGVPVVMTDVPLLAGEVNAEKAGKVIAYDPHELVEAISTILQNNRVYRRNCLSLAAKYEYRSLYDSVFKLVASRLWPES